MTINELSLWIKENTTLSDSSVYKYSRAVNTISNEMLAKKVIPVSLFNLSSIELDFYLPIILNDESFKTKNATGNNMYSNALKQYRMCCLSLQTEDLKETEIVEKIENYDLLNETEKTAVVKSRVGQGLFRKKVIDKYDGKCIITGIASKKLLIASHIKPWAVSNNTERLSEDNGLLLSPTFDKLFDYGLITFTNAGKVFVSSQIPQSDINKLNLTRDLYYDLKATQKTYEYLDYHRDMIFLK